MIKNLLLPSLFKQANETPTASAVIKYIPKL